MAKNLNFNVGDELTLTLQDLWANIEVRKGQVGKATVDLSGDDKLLEQIKVTQPSPDQLLIKGSDEGGGLTVISGRSGSISVGNIRGRGIVIGGSIVGRNVITDDLVVIHSTNIVSGGSGKVTVIEGGEMPKIIVTVPQGTDLEAYDVQSVNSHGLCGKLDVSLSGQGEATVDDVKGMKVRCSGQSHANITNASGNLKASVSGQSSISVVGKLGDVEAEASGQSSVTVNGSCENCNVDASGMSHVTVSGHATGKVRKHSSGMSHVSVG